MLVRRTFSPFDLSSTGGFDRAFQQLVTGFAAPVARRAPAVTATTDAGTLTVTVDLPGVPAEAIGVEVSGRTLTVSADHDGQTWQRSTRLGAQFDLDTVAATYVDGRLSVTVGSSPEPEVRKVAVTVGAPAAVPAGSTAAVATAETTEATEATEPETVQVTSEVTEGPATTEG